MPLLDSNKERETIRDDEGHTLSHDESMEERDKFKGITGEIIILRLVKLEKNTL